MNVKPVDRPRRIQEDEMWNLLSGQKLRAMKGQVKHVAQCADSCTGKMLEIELMMRPA